MRHTEAYWDDRWDAMHDIETTGLSSEFQRIRQRRTLDSRNAHPRRNSAHKPRSGWGPFPGPHDEGDSL